MDKEKRSASDVLEGVVKDSQADYISLLEIKMALHERGFGLLMLFFAVPLSLPLPVPPGITMIPGIPLLLFSTQMLWGADSPWLPKWVGNKKIKRETIAFLFENAAPYLKKVEKFLRPRFSFASSALGEKVVGVFGVIFSLSIMNPLPFTNWIPALGILLMALGLISKDGIAVVLGMIVGSIGTTIPIMIFLLGKEAVIKMFFG